MPPAGRESARKDAEWGEEEEAHLDGRRGRRCCGRGCVCQLELILQQSRARDAHIVHAALDDDPGRVGRRVLSDLLEGVGLRVGVSVQFCRSSAQPWTHLLAHGCRGGERESKKVAGSEPFSTSRSPNHARRPGRPAEPTMLILQATRARAPRLALATRLSSTAASPHQLDQQAPAQPLKGKADWKRRQASPPLAPLGYSLELTRTRPRPQEGSNFIDTLNLSVVSGRGGAGGVAFHREKFKVRPKSSSADLPAPRATS